MPHYIPRSELYYSLGVLFPMPSQSERRTEDTEDQQGDPERSSLMVCRKVLFSFTSSLLVIAHTAAITTAATNPHPTPCCLCQFTCPFKPSIWITLCMKYEWAKFFIIWGYLITQTVTETREEMTLLEEEEIDTVLSQNWLKFKRKKKWQNSYCWEEVGAWILIQLANIKSSRRSEWQTKWMTF